MGADNSESLGALLRRLATPRTREDEALSLAAFLAERGIAPSRERIGRYVVRKLLGRGGFGAVILADDPLLHRRVAIKVSYRIVDNADGREQFAAEARRLAKFSHPHVVQVFDHGQSQFGPWIAMEYVEGETVRAWQSERRPWREVVEVYAQAARGLAAAHAVDLVHCDIKPGNLLRRADGRVLVGDFGLALVGSGSQSAADRIADASREQDDEGSQTEGGTRGTPGYQAPEVIAARPADARSDQYSLCVSMLEALGGRHLIAGRAGRRTDPRLAGVPRWLTRVLARGVEPDPKDRYPTVDALVRELTRPRRGVGYRSFIVVPIAMAGLGAVESREQDDCAGVGDIASVWSPAKRELVSGAFERPAMRARVIETIDAHARAWEDDRVAICGPGAIDTGTEATTSLTCLTRRRDNLASVVGLLQEHGARGQADELLARLDPAPSCRTGHEAPSAASHTIGRADGSTAFKDIDDAATQLAVAKYDAALTAANRGLLLALESGSADAEAEARFVRGRILDELGRDEDAQAELSSAALLADASRNALLAASAWHALTRLAAVDLADAALARDAAERGRVAVARAGASAALDADNKVAFAAVSLLQGDERETERLLREALERRGDGSLLDTHVAEIETLLANSLARQGRLDEADELYAHALETQVTLRGDDHPEVARLEFNLGVDARERERYEDARAHLLRALEIQQAVFGTDSIRIAPTLVLLAELSLRARELDTAAELATRARAIETASLPRFHPDRGNAVALLSGIHFERGDFEASLEASMARMDELVTGAPEEAEVANMIGWLLCKLDRCAEAGTYYARVQALARDPVTAAFGEGGLACVQLEIDPERALPMLERALARALEVEEPSLIAELEERLALALTRLHRTPERARALRRSAKVRTDEIETHTLMDAGDATVRAQSEDKYD